MQVFFMSHALRKKIAPSLQEGMSLIQILKLISSYFTQHEWHPVQSTVFSLTVRHVRLLLLDCKRHVVFRSAAENLITDRHVKCAHSK